MSLSQLASLGSALPALTFGTTTSVTTYLA